MNAKDIINEDTLLALINLELDRQGKLHLLAIEKSHFVETLKETRAGLIKDIARRNNK